MSRVEGSLKMTIAIVAAFFLLSITIVLISPRFVDESWMSPSSSYQVQLYEELDPNLFISSNLQVQRVFNGKTHFAYVNTPHMELKGDSELEKYITKEDEPLKLTKRLLLLKKTEEGKYDLYDPQKEVAYILSNSDGNVENWSDEEGVLYVKNPQEYLGDLKQFHTRKELIEEGERIYAIEGCWYCHTDQTRTLVQDTVLNGSDSFPAPPSSANEYIYQNITFPGTRRIGPDLSRVGVKRPSRDWHKAHFWAPKTQSPGSIMPSFHHFFDEDPRGTPGVSMGIPNYRFEAIYQYLMTKGTRITPPSEAWWLGKDPVKTKELIERK